MAGLPPNYPPPGSPSGSPFGFDPKQQARFARQQFKDQARAHKAAARAQRDLFRYQARGLRRSSILGPLIILTIGVLALLIRMGRIPLSHFWSWYGQWWPVLLVGAGVILVAEWAVDQIPRSDGAPNPRRGIGGGAIFLLLLLAIGGAISHGIDVHGRDLLVNNFSLDSDTIDQFFGEKHESSQPFEAAFPAGSSLAIDNPHGDVTITGKSNDNQVHVVVNKQVYSQSDSDADAKAQKLNPRISMVGSILSVSIASLDGASADLSITVPDFGQTSVTSNHGDISISGLRAPVTVTANHGDVDLKSITGAVSAHLNHRGASFSARQITGDLTVRGHAEDLTVADISGQTSLEGEFYGDTHLEHLQGPTSFRTSRTQLQLTHLLGELDISPHSDLTGDHIAGPTTLHTRSRNITLEDIAGDIDIVNSDGSVDLKNAPPLGNVSIENKNGEVNITVPEHANFVLDAQSKDGEIESDLDLKSSTSGNHSLQGTAGSGGPRITIRTTHLNVGIHKNNEGPLPPMPPPPPTSPAPPARST